MLYFYKVLRSDGTIVCLLTYDNTRPNITDPLVVEITRKEYEVLLAEIEAANQPEETDEISTEEALDIILGVSE